MCRGRAVEHFKLHNHAMIIRFQLRQSRSKLDRWFPGMYREETGLEAHIRLDQPN